MSEHPHVLLADDDADTRRIFGHYLSKARFEVLYAKDGNECREMARRLQPDIILLDYHLPVMDGLEAAKLLKGESETAHIPIVLFTNEDLSIEAEKAFREIGIDDYLHKSIDPSMLIERVQKHLKKGGRPAARIVWMGPKHAIPLVTT